MLIGPGAGQNWRSNQRFRTTCERVARSFLPWLSSVLDWSDQRSMTIPE
jgi:hypothetical protein